MKIYPIFLFCIDLFIFFVSCEELTFDRTLKEYLSLTTALKFNDRCSWKFEAERQNFSRKLLESGSVDSEAAAEYFTDVVVNEKKLCNALEQFICDKETERCVCGEVGKKILFPAFNLSSEYEVVKDEGGIYRCEWKEGSFCMTDDMIRELMPQLKNVAKEKIYQKCVDGTSCMSTSSNENGCSVDLLMDYALKSKANATGEWMAKRVADGSICSCQGNVANNYGSGGYATDSRVKRSVGENIGDGDREWAKGVIATALKYF